MSISFLNFILFLDYIDALDVSLDGSIVVGGSLRDVIAHSTATGMYVCLYVCMSVCLSVFMFLYIYIYIYIERERERKKERERERERERKRESYLSISLPSYVSSYLFVSLSRCCSMAKENVRQGVVITHPWRCGCCTC